MRKKSIFIQKILFIATIVLLSFFSFIGAFSYSNNNNNNKQSQYISNEDNDVSLIHVKDNWDKDNKKHVIKVVFDGDLPSDSTYDIFNPDEKSIFEGLDRPKINFDSIGKEGDYSYFLIDDLGEAEKGITYESDYTFELIYPTDKFQEITFKTIVEPIEFSYVLENEGTNSHSLYFDFKYTQANENAYKNTKVKFTLFDGEEEKNSQEIETKNDVGDKVKIKFDSLEAEKEYTVLIQTNNNKSKEYKEAGRENFTTTIKPKTFKSNFSFTKEEYDDVKGYCSWKGNDDFSTKATKVSLDLFENNDNKEPISECKIPVNDKKGKYFVDFSKLDHKEIKYGKNYYVKETVYYEDEKYIVNPRVYKTSTLNKNKDLKGNTSINFNESDVDVSGTYIWSGNDSEISTILVDHVDLELYKESSPEELIDSKEIINNDDGTSGIKDFSFENVPKGDEIKFLIIEKIYYKDKWQKVDETTFNFSFTYKTTTAEVLSYTTDGSNLEIKMKINDTKKFKKNKDERISINFNDKSLNKYKLLYVNDSPIGNPYLMDSIFFATYDQLSKKETFIEDKENSTATFTMEFNGLPWNGERIHYTISLERNDVKGEVVSNFDKILSINPNSFQYEKRIFNDDNTCSLKIKWDIKNPQQLKDFDNNISLSKKRKNKVSPIEQDKSIKIINQNTSKDIFGDHDINNYLYLNVPTKIINKHKKKNLSFLKDRYIYLENNSINKKNQNTETYNAFFISSFKTSPPYMVIGLSLSIILIAIIIVAIIYTYNTNPKKRFEFLQTYSEELYNKLINQYNVFATNDKYEEYLKLKKMSDKDIKEYLKNMNVSLPEDFKHGELVKVASLLSEDEILFAENLIKYELGIENKISLEAKESFDKKNEKWIKKKILSNDKKEDNDSILKDDEIIQEVENNSKEIIKKDKKKKFVKKEIKEQTEEQIILSINPYENKDDKIKDDQIVKDSKKNKTPKNTDKKIIKKDKKKKFVEKEIKEQTEEQIILSVDPYENKDDKIGGALND